MRLRTPRLELIAATAELAAAEWQDRHSFSATLRAEVPAEWPPDLTEDRLEPNAARLSRHPAEAGWWFWYLVLVEPAPRTAIGTAGFKGLPDARGAVEIGYSLLEAYRCRGYATEGVGALVDWALTQPGVGAVQAETYPSLLGSIGLLQRLGFKAVGEGSGPGIVRYVRARDPQPVT